MIKPRDPNADFDFTDNSLPVTATPKLTERPQPQEVQSLIKDPHILRLLSQLDENVSSSNAIPTREELEPLINGLLDMNYRNELKIRGLTSDNARLLKSMVKVKDENFALKIRIRELKLERNLRDLELRNEKIKRKMEKVEWKPEEEKQGWAKKVLVTMVGKGKGRGVVSW